MIEGHMVKMSAVSSKIEQLWKRVDGAYKRAEEPPPSRISNATYEHLDVGVPEATIRGWLNKKTRRLPRNEDQLINFVTALHIIELINDDQPVPDPAKNALSGKEREEWKSLLQASRTSPPKKRLSKKVWLAAAVVITIAVVVIFWPFDNNKAPATLPSIHYERGHFPTSPGPQSNGGPLVACPPATTNKPDSVAESKGHSARAEYYAKNRLFLLYDNDADGESAILRVTNADGSRTDWYNQKGETCAGKYHPLAMIVDDIDVSHGFKYDVCIGEWGKRGTVPPERCSEPVGVPPNG